MTGATNDERWVVRWGQRLVYIQADDATNAIEGSITALRGLGDWPEDPAELTAFPRDEYHTHSRPRDFTRAVISDRDRARKPSRTRPSR